MRKALVTFFSILMSCVVSFGQYNYNNIVLFDCTKSMTHPNALTREDYRGEGEPDIIWKPAKMALKDLFIQAEDEDNFTILLFQESILDIIEGKKKNLNWPDIDRRLESAVQKPDDTCICGAWDKAETYLREGVGEFNFFYLFTDGCEDCNYPSHDVTDKIREFCKNQRTDIRKFGFYLMLTEKAGNKGVKQALEGSCIKPLIIEPGATIHPFGAFVNRTISVSTDDMMSSMGKYDRVASVSNRFSRKKASYQLAVTSNDPYFNVEIQNNCIDNGEVVFLVSAQKESLDVSKLRNDIQSDTYRFKVQLSSSEVDLHNDSQEIIVNLRAVRSVEVLGDYIKLGTADYYPKFMFFPEKEIQKLRKPIDIRFSKSIFSDNQPGVIKWEISPKDSNCTFFYNGEKCQDNVFYMTSEDAGHELSLLFDNKAFEGDFEFTIKPVSVNGIEFINAMEPSRFEYKIYSEFDLVWNPVKKILLLLFILFTLVTIVIFIYKNIIVRRIMDKQICQLPDIYNPVAEVHNCVKCIITSKRGTGKNGFLSRIYRGPIYYIKIDDAVSDIELKINFDDDVIVKPNSNYLLNGIPLTSSTILQSNCKQDFAIVNSNKKFTIIIY